uniref:Polygalacturonase n=1 Tax=Kalanchoe fedtschenkoi TaxID=63787 RepID=A0A7N0VHI4_KALFE
MILHVLVFANDVSSYDRLWSYDFENNGYDDAGQVFNVIDFGAAGDGLKDDTKALSDAWNAACAAGQTPTILVPRDKTIMVNPIQFDGTKCKFSGVHLQLEGQIVAPSRKGWANCAGNWFDFDHVNGLTIDGNGLFYAHGEAYWQRPPGSLGEDESRFEESLMHFESCNHLTLHQVNTKDSPGVHLSIWNSANVEISNVNISAPGDSPNTDGINLVASKKVIIRDSTIATGDDCIAINSGSQYFNISNVACGPGHGISIGSLGKNGGFSTVEDVHVKDCSFTASQNGARIKTYQGGKGYARRIVYEGITLVNASNPIYIDQRYCARQTCQDQPDAVAISDVSYINFHGTSADQNAIILDCATSGAGCQNIILDNIDIKSANPATPAQTVCTNAHGKVTKTSPEVSCFKESPFAHQSFDEYEIIPTLD